MDDALTGPITGVVPLIIVVDIERAVAFYRLLGFEVGNYQPRTGEKHWAWLYAPQAPDWRRGPNLMLTRGEEQGPGIRPGTTTLYLYSVDSTMLLVGAAMMGAFGMGVWGMAPAYTVERYPTEARGVGPGFCYPAGAAIGATMPTLLGFLQDRGFGMVNAMSAAMAVSALVALAAIWSGPETRGRAFD
jgi:catechol 2,3-dioxygenase-like lactoylglutathione lyase family enzyme